MTAEEFAALSNAVQAQYTKEEWERMHHSPAVRFTAEEIAEMAGASQDASPADIQAAWNALQVVPSYVSRDTSAEPMLVPTRRVIFSCKRCAFRGRESVWAHDYYETTEGLFRIVSETGAVRVPDRDSACPTCSSRYVKMTRVRGVISEKPCDDRCLNAVGSVCNCSCGGRNHGGMHVRERMPQERCSQCRFPLCPNCEGCHSQHCRDGMLPGIACVEAMDEVSRLQRGEMRA